MHDWMPEDLELCEDVSAARWVEDRLRPWDRPYVRVHSYMPDAFDAYARVLHPAWPMEGSGWITWSRLGAARGVAPGAETTFAEVAGIPSPQDPTEFDGPEQGSMPAHLMVALAGVLAPFTSTPGACRYCFWEGDGRFWSSAHSLLASSEQLPELDEQAAARRLESRLNAVPRVEAPARAYFLFSGPLTVVAELATRDPMTPALNMWWPEDRAWFVSTEVDSISTYVGGTREAVDAVVASPELEAVEARIDSRLDPRT